MLGLYWMVVNAPPDWKIESTHGDAQEAYRAAQRITDDSLDIQIRLCETIESDNSYFVGRTWPGQRFVVLVRPHTSNLAAILVLAALIVILVTVTGALVYASGLL